MGKVREDAILRAQHLLPENARELVRLISLPMTMKLVDLLGGTHFPIPKTARQEGQYFSALAEVVGVDAARTLTKHYGNTRLYVPKCAAALRALRDAEIRADYDRHCRELGHNATVNNILVPKFKLCDRRIEEILSKADELLPENVPQGQLF
ncbi:Mor transcription activator family protein [Paludibacterium denitrificans]|uniref:Transcriptional regulator n=1 Tax=Paludibacterium denitrificans TaxID=2675226 RepID=A0A844GBC9_9NEIS|nr:Mor transcription activator family protein [Paludibacterium denitrificans]MTD32538.1 transcriptional regulator [Paludibacterium denitrificans]